MKATHTGSRGAMNMLGLLAVGGGLWWLRLYQTRPPVLTQQQLEQQAIVFAKHMGLPGVPVALASTATTRGALDLPTTRCRNPWLVVWERLNPQHPQHCNPRAPVLLVTMQGGSAGDTTDAQTAWVVTSLDGMAMEGGLQPRQQPLPAHWPVP